MFMLVFLIITCQRQDTSWHRIWLVCGQSSGASVTSGGQQRRSLPHSGCSFPGRDALPACHKSRPACCCWLICPCEGFVPPERSESCVLTRLWFMFSLATVQKRQKLRCFFPFFAELFSTISWHISHSQRLKKQTFFSLTRPPLMRLLMCSKSKCELRASPGRAGSKNAGQPNEKHGKYVYTARKCLGGIK